MDQRARHWPLLVALSATLVTAVVAATAVLAIRWVLRQDLVDSAEARTVIRVAKLRAAAERLGGHARGFLLTANPGSFDRVTRDREVFFGRLDGLLQEADGPTRTRLEEVRRAARAYDDALEAVMALRTRSEATEAVADAFEESVRPRKEALDQSLATLIEKEEARLHALDQSTERAASRLATIAFGVAVGALLVSLALSVLLARTFRSLRAKQAELEKAMTRIENANRDLDAFAGRIAHDVRTPLTPITLMADRLRRSTDENVVRAAERIQRSAAAASRMVEGLLAFSRLGRGSGSASTAAASAIRDTIENFSEQIAAEAITVETDLDEGAVVACDESLFRQVVANLMGNAIKFLAGRDQRSIKLTLAARESVCALDIEDTGPGIPSESLGRIFEPFYRVPGVATPGSGLGLATVRRIVEVHQGSVTVTSEMGHGTTFRLVLPAKPPGPQPARGPAPTSTTTAHVPV